MTLIRRTAGLWGPALFATAAVVAARIQSGYSHLTHHISGLAAAGQRSTMVMVPGFAALGTATLLMPVPGRTVRMLTWVAGTGVLAAGVIPASQPRCPQPGTDPEATASDVGHGIASVIAFVAWAALPYVAGAKAPAGWYRRVNRALRFTTTLGFAAAAGTTQLDLRPKGLAQRGFLASVFTWYLATSAAAPRAT